MKKLTALFTILFAALNIVCASGSGDSATSNDSSSKGGSTVNQIYLTAIRSEASSERTTWTVELESNKSATALVELLQKGDVTVHAHDYGDFEKVGNFGTSLPRTDKQITTKPGDLILYQGNQITLYYDTNSWNFTKLGHIEGATREGLLKVLGSGDVDLVLSLEK